MERFVLIATTEKNAKTLRFCYSTSASFTGKEVLKVLKVLGVLKVLRVLGILGILGVLKVAP